MGGVKIPAIGDVKRINYKSDFSVTVRLKQGDTVVDFPLTDFSILFTTNIGRYECFCKGGTYTHCKRNDDGSVTCFLDGHGLHPGMLKAEVRIDNIDGNYTDGFRREVSLSYGNIELVTGNGNGYDASMDVVLSVAVVNAYQLAVQKGYEGTIEEYYATFSRLTETLHTVEETLTHIKDGKSAYELAKEQGYVGTLADWLASLKGERGAIGWLPVVVHDEGTALVEMNACEEHHIKGKVTQLYFTVNKFAQTNTENEYRLCFATGNAAPNISFPESVKMPAGVKFAANRYYELSIAYNAEQDIYVCFIGEVDV